MKTKIIAALAVAFSVPSLAATEIVKCHGEYQGKHETIELKIGDDGKVVNWDKSHMAKSKTSFLGGLANDIEEYGYEWTKNFRTESGVTILEMGTTADSFKIAISADHKRASFVYSDLGSGAGRHEFELSCETE